MSNFVPVPKKPLPKMMSNVYDINYALPPFWTNRESRKMFEQRKVIWGVFRETNKMASGTILGEGCYQAGKL